MMRVPVWLTRRCGESLGTAARVVLGVVLLWAGAAKLGDLAGSVRAVHAYQLLPYEVSTVVGSALPWVEIAVGALLVMGLATRLAAVAGGALLAAFTAGIATAWARGLSIDCGCFGGGGQLAAGQSPQYGTEIARDIALLVAAAYLVAWPVTTWSVDRWLAPDDITRNTSDTKESTDPSGDRQSEEASR